MNCREDDEWTNTYEKCVHFIDVSGVSDSFQIYLNFAGIPELSRSHLKIAVGWLVGEKCLAQKIGGG